MPFRLRVFILVVKILAKPKLDVIGYLGLRIFGDITVERVYRVFLLAPLIITPTYFIDAQTRVLGIRIIFYCFPKNGDGLLVSAQIKKTVAYLKGGLGYQNALRII